MAGLELYFDPQCIGGHRFELDAVEAVEFCLHRCGTVHRLPLSVFSVKDAPAVWNSAAATSGIVEPIDVDRRDFVGAIEIVLHPLGCSLVIPPGESR